MKSTEIANYRETDDQWLTSLVERRQELSLQLARLDIEIDVVRRTLRARETARTKGVFKDRES
jgi:hypothetical protein